MNKKAPRDPDETPASTKIIMAVVAVLILLGLYYVFGQHNFPKDIRF